METTPLDYVIQFERFVFQGDLSFGEAPVYNECDWFDATVPENFPTRVEAFKWFVVHYRGQNRDGIEPKFFVYAKTREANSNFVFLGDLESNP
jgi:hypothetical protein